MQKHLSLYFTETSLYIFAAGTTAWAPKWEAASPSPPWNGNACCHGEKRSCSKWPGRSFWTGQGVGPHLTAATGHHWSCPAWPWVRLFTEGCAITSTWAPELESSSKVLHVVIPAACEAPKLAVLNWRETGVFADINCISWYTTLI